MQIRFHCVYDIFDVQKDSTVFVIFLMYQATLLHLQKLGWNWKILKINLLGKGLFKAKELKTHFATFTTPCMQS